MHPAFSVIFFTTASGLGYGMLALLGLMGPAGALPIERWFGVTAFGLSLAAISLGLLASTFHLGHPERAWRAVAQWRSSWLAREGVMAIATYVPAGLFALGWVVLETSGGAWGGLGVLAAICAGLTVAATSLIYRSLKTIHQWHNGFTMPAYLLLGLGTGALALQALLHLFGEPRAAVAAVALGAGLAGWAVKWAYWRFIDESRARSTAETATGLKGGRVRLLDPPHTQDNFLLKEMGYRVARNHSRRLRLIAQFAGFALPLALTVAALTLPTLPAAMAAVLAALSGGLGVVVERWLFFAEARHAVTLFYGASTV
ncbi:MAG: dimethyl sulfoxide reductase anchor subunit [Alphaproteobacteria bacterium]|nr:dimethyl sulfoxide reductase anchor subunit [Alphaproteobacteria bacterium]